MSINTKSSCDTFAEYPVNASYKYTLASDDQFSLKKNKNIFDSNTTDDSDSYFDQILDESDKHVENEILF